MEVSSLEPHREGHTDKHPLLMERSENHSDHEHVIDIARGSDASASSSSNSDSHDPEPAQSTDRPSIETLSPNVQSTSRNSSSVRRGDGYGRRRRSPLNSRLWISIELVLNVSQIIVAIIVLALSRHEKPQAPLFEWIVGYAVGCAATLPILYWRYRHRNNGQEPTQSVPQSNSPVEPTPYTAISVSRASEEEEHHATITSTRGGQNMIALFARLNVLVDHYKMALDCFFAVWFVVGNVWIFGGHSSSTDAPNLYRLCIVFLTFSCIGYAMPFILCATICCCLPCIISILGFREDLSHTRGATPESISALPTYKFKLKKNHGRGDEELNSEGMGVYGVVAAGTEKERAVSAEDAVCCICLAKYADNEELRELPCTHFFHMECVDKWLKINGLCPLCKCEVGERCDGSPPAENSSQPHVMTGAGNG